MNETKLVRDLEDFASGPWSLVVEKKNRILYRSKEEGLQPLLDCISKHGEGVTGATVYDKMVGRAAALLSVHARAGQVLTPVISNGGAEVLEQFGVRFVALDRVESILDAEQTGPCPMEKKAKGRSPQEFYSLFAK